MRQPDSLLKQYQGKALAEVYRGSGQFPFQEYPCHLEPPWEEFDRNGVNPWECYVNGWEGAWAAGMFGQKISTDLVLRESSPLALLPWPSDDSEYLSEEINRLSVVSIEQFPDDETSIAKAQQFLLSRVVGV